MCKERPQVFGRSIPRPAFEEVYRFLNRPIFCATGAVIHWFRDIGQTRGGRCAARGSPLCTTWTSCTAPALGQSGGSGFNRRHLPKWVRIQPALTLARRLGSGPQGRDGVCAQSARLLGAPVAARGPAGDRDRLDRRLSALRWIALIRRPVIGSLEISQWAFPAERHASEPHPRAHGTSG
jgi:hypothetical protein